MKKFEYLVKDSSIFDDLGKLNSYGYLGWEMIGYYEDLDKVVFKRAIPVDDEDYEEDYNEYEDYDEDEDYDSDNSDIMSFYNDDTLYEDSFVKLEYKGMETTNNLFYGAGIGFKFIIENKFCNTVKVFATNIAINGFIVASSEMIVGDLSGFRKAIDRFYLYYNNNNLSECGIDTEADIRTVSFYLEIQDENYDVIDRSYKEITIYG